MKKIIVALSFFVSLHIYAIPEGVDAQYAKTATSLLKKSVDATKIVHHLFAVAEDQPLSEAQQKQFQRVVCESVRLDFEFMRYVATDINQARIIMEDDQLDEKYLMDVMKGTMAYKYTQRLIGTPYECKY